MVHRYDFSGSYVIRHGWTRLPTFCTLSMSVAIAVCFIPGFGLEHHVELLLSPIVLLFLVVCSSRRKSVEFDERGVTLHHFWLPRRAETIPWSDVLAVALHRSDHWRTELVVFRRTAPGASPFRAPADHPAMIMFNQLLTRIDDPEFVEIYRTATQVRRDTSLCRVDPFLLASAVALLAPGVRHFGELGRLDLGDLALVLSEDTGSEDTASGHTATGSDSGDRPEGTTPGLSGS
ncbi:hypothetical protein ACIQF6_19355 [Kitasatospora sp. NPDC092948]|uniref:hypothetical protein n=1 Tax=Kitasatospora sp. NPDC092948 TaxID=3364088 RepID=UPI003822DDAD